MFQCSRSKQFLSQRWPGGLFWRHAATQVTPQQKSRCFWTIRRRTTQNPQKKSSKLIFFLRTQWKWRRLWRLPEKNEGRCQDPHPRDLRLPLQETQLQERQHINHHGQRLHQSWRSFQRNLHQETKLRQQQDSPSMTGHFLIVIKNLNSCLLCNYQSIDLIKPFYLGWLLFIAIIKFIIADER